MEIVCEGKISGSVLVSLLWGGEKVAIDVNNKNECAVVQSLKRIKIEKARR